MDVQDVLRLTFRISATACFTRVMAGCDFQPKVLRRNRVLNSHLCLVRLITYGADQTSYGDSCLPRSSIGEVLPEIASAITG